MIYTKLTKEALKIAFNAHKEQIDKSGLPYVFHPFHLAEQMEDENSVCVALLHDVLEDSKYTVSDLECYGFPEEVIKALKTLTHNKDIDYFEYIENIKKNRLATTVKIVDLKHNMDMTRLNEITNVDLERIEKYQKALAILLK